jgi:uncharacterized protein HemY
MFRIFALIITLITLYFTFSYLGKYDSVILIEAYGYKIKSNAFFIGALLIITYIAFMILMKALIALLNLPRNVMNLFTDYKNKKDNRNILTACTYLMAGNNIEAINIARKYLTYKNDSIKKVAKMIMSRGLHNRDKVIYLQEMLEYPELRLYANRSLAETLLQAGDYNNALMFATDAHSLDNNDSRVLKLLFEIYAKLQHWSKFSYVLEKLNKQAPEYVANSKEQIANVFFTAAKRSLEVGNDQETIEYLEQSILYKPDYMPSLNLLTELYNNIGKQEQTLNIIEKAFSYKPSLELFEIYKTCTDKSPLEIYNALAGEANPHENVPIFLKIASNLGLDDVANELSNNIKLSK